MNTAYVADVLAYCRGERTIDEVLNTLLEPIYRYLNIRHQNGSKCEQYTMYEVWEIIATAAESIPFQEQEPILRLSEALKLRKVPIDEETKKSWSLQDDELDDVNQPPPFLGAVIREELDIVSDQADAYINLCAFSAHLTIWTSTNLGDFSLHGLWMLREAFEEHDSIEDLIRHQSIIKIRAARIWLQIASKKLFKACIENEEFTGRMGTIGKGARADLNEHIKGFTLERWRFWHSRILGICQSIESDDILKEECKLALQAMKEIGTV